MPLTDHLNAATRLIELIDEILALVRSRPSHAFGIPTAEYNLPPESLPKFEELDARIVASMIAAGLSLPPLASGDDQYTQSRGHTGLRILQTRSRRLDRPEEWERRLIALKGAAQEMLELANAEKRTRPPSTISPQASDSLEAGRGGLKKPIEPAETGRRSWDQPALDKEIETYKVRRSREYYSAIKRIESAKGQAKKRAIEDARKLFGRNVIAKHYQCKTPTMVGKSAVWRAMAEALALSPRKGGGRTKRGLEIVEAEAVAGQNPTDDEVDRREAIKRARAELPAKEAAPIIDDLERGGCPDKANQTIDTLLS